MATWEIESVTILFRLYICLDFYFDQEFKPSLTPQIKQKTSRKPFVAIVHGDARAKRPATSQ